MSLYLDELGRDGRLAERIRDRVLDSRGPLFNDPREVLEDELREPGVYFSILEELGTGAKASGEVEPALADHVVPVFEALCRAYVRRTRGRRASRVGSWWGAALHEILLFSRAGFTEALAKDAAARTDVTLVTAADVVKELE